MDKLDNQYNEINEFGCNILIPCHIWKASKLGVGVGMGITITGKSVTA